MIRGDYIDTELMAQADAYAADIFIGMTDRDQDNLVLCQIAREYYQVPNILAVVNDPDNEDVFRKMGVRAVSSSRFLIESIESMSAVDEIKQQFSAVEGRIMLTELQIGPSAKVTGKMLQDISLPGGVLVASILRKDELIIPRGATQILEGDLLLIISLPDNQSVALNSFS